MARTKITRRTSCAKKPSNQKKVYKIARMSTSGVAPQKQLATWNRKKEVQDDDYHFEWESTDTEEDESEDDSEDKELGTPQTDVVIKVEEHEEQEDVEYKAEQDDCENKAKGDLPPDQMAACLFGTTSITIEFHQL